MATRDELFALAEANDVSVSSKALKAEIEEALADAGVEIPANGDDNGGETREAFSIVPENEIDTLEGLKLSALPKSKSGLYAVKYDADSGFSAEPYNPPKKKEGDEE